MKKLFLLMALFATTVFVACSDDDDNAQINLEELVGTWRYMHSVGYEIDGNAKDEWDEDMTNAQIYFVFNADKTGIIAQTNCTLFTNETYKKTFFRSI